MVLLCNLIIDYIPLTHTFLVSDVWLARPAETADTEVWTFLCLSRILQYVSIVESGIYIWWTSDMWVDAS